MINKWFIYFKFKMTRDNKQKTASAKGDVKNEMPTENGEGNMDRSACSGLTIPQIEYLYSVNEEKSLSPRHNMVVTTS